MKPKFNKKHNFDCTHAQKILPFLQGLALFLTTIFTECLLAEVQININYWSLKAMSPI